MPYCYNCGKQISVEDKFCTSCSYPIQSQVIGTTEVLVTREERTSEVKKCICEVVGTVKNMIITPLETIQRCGDTVSIRASIIIAAIMCGLSGTFFVWIAKIIEGYIKAKVNKNQVLRQQSQVDEMTYLSNLFNFTYRKIFINGFSAMALIIILTALLAFCICKYLFKSKLKLEGVWKIVICSYIPLSIGSLISICLGYLSLKFMVLALLAASIVFLICIYTGFKQAANLNSKPALLLVVTQGVMPMIVANYFAQKLLSSWFNNIAAKSVIQSLYFVFFNGGF